MSNIELNNGQMLDFDGVSDHVDIDVTLGSEFTIRFDANVFGYIIGGDIWDDLVFVDSLKTRIRLGYVDYDFLQIYASVETTLHIVVNSTTISLYANGIFQQSMERTESALPTFNYIARQIDAYGQGSIGNVQFWKTALTPQQVAYDFNNPHRALYVENDILKSNNPDVDVADCVSWYPLTEGQGSYIRDMVNYDEGDDNKTYNRTYDGDEAANWSDITNTSFSLEVSNIGTNNQTPAIGYNLTVNEGDVIKITITANPPIPNSNFIKINGDSSTEYIYGSPLSQEEYEIIYKYNGSISFITLQIDGTDAIFNSNVIFEVKQLSGITKISNTAPDTVAWVNGKGSNKGLQLPLLQRDSLGRLLGLADGINMYGQKPALAIGMTDTELWESGSEFGFSIEFVIERELIEKSRGLLYSFNGAVGMIIWVNRTFSTSGIRLYLFNGSSNVYVASNIDENKHHIVFTVSPTHLTIWVDGVTGTSVEHSFVPSGLNFKDSTQIAPAGTLHQFKLYNRALLQQEVKRLADEAIAKYNIT